MPPQSRTIIGLDTGLAIEDMGPQNTAKKPTKFYLFREIPVLYKRL